MPFLVIIDEISTEVYTCSPQASSGVKKCLHLGAHHAETCWKSKNNRVSIDETVWIQDGNLWLGWCMHLLQNLLRQRLCNLNAFGGVNMSP
jgi:hypothetical protein